MFSEHTVQTSKNWRIQNSLFETRKKRGKTFVRFSVWDDDGEDRVELNHRYSVELNHRYSVELNHRYSVELNHRYSVDDHHDDDGAEAKVESTMRGTKDTTGNTSKCQGSSKRH
jgi:hypothetical protein